MDIRNGGVFRTAAYVVKIFSDVGSVFGFGGVGFVVAPALFYVIRRSNSI